jgi:two-component system, sensor histidine kinase PdtaS
VVESPSIKAAKAELAELNASLAARVEAATGELRDLVGQKDALLREVHHRVKNNLQIVANLLTMKSRNAPPEARQALLETSDRVHAIGAVHEALYERAGESGVLLAERLRVIAEHLIASYGAGGRVTVEVEDADLRLSLAASIPLALLATELASNALKHAFPGDRPGRIEIGLRRSGPERFELTVTDNGVGWTPEAARKGSGLGIALALAKQLGGELTIESRPGGGLTAALRAPVQ